MPYWFKVTYLLNILGILTTGGEKIILTRMLPHESFCSVKSSLRELRFMSHQSEILRSLIFCLSEIQYRLLPAATKLWPRKCFYRCVSVHRGGVCLSACWDAIPPDGGTPPGPGRPPPDGEPPREADSSIRSTSGRYASYWNAFLLCNNLYISAV